MKRRHILLLAFLGLLALPQQASANAGTPLMWAGMIHLVIGNAVIGLFESVLIAWLFNVPRSKAIGAMILANYVSAWLGGLFIRGAIVKALPIDLTNGWMWFWIMVVVTYGLTLLLEWPFIAWGFRGSRDWLKQSVKASLVVLSAVGSKCTTSGQVKLYHPGLGLVIGFRGWVSRFVSVDLGCRREDRALQECNPSARRSRVSESFPLPVSSHEALGVLLSSPANPGPKR